MTSSVAALAGTNSTVWVRPESGLESESYPLLPFHQTFLAVDGQRRALRLWAQGRCVTELKAHL